MWTTTRLHRISHDKRGVSNVIVIVLSLVILVMVASNVILWSYQMNQLDWERMQEEVRVTDVQGANSSKWFTTENEYTTLEGDQINGTYQDTKEADGGYESFQEGLSYQLMTLRPSGPGEYSAWSSEYPLGSEHWSLTVEDPPDDDDTYVENNAATFKSESYSLEDTVGSGTISWVRVYVRARLTDSGSSVLRTLLRTNNTDFQSEDITLPTSYQDNFTQYDTNPSTASDWTWAEIDSLEAGASSQKVSDNVRMTAVWVIVNYTASEFTFDMNGSFSIDLSMYPLSCIRTIEVQLRYRANDTIENWHLEAYNWTSMTYSDAGFNDTSGHTSTTEWAYYSVNLTDGWRSYVQEEGTMNIKLRESLADENQTIIDIDFLGVRAFIDGALFSLKSAGALTCHVVSIWMINSTTHTRYETDVYINAGELLDYLRADISLPDGDSYLVKVTTERGNIALYSPS